MNDLNHEKLMMSSRDLAATEQEGEDFDIQLSKADLEPVPAVKKVNYLTATINAMDSDEGFIVKLSLEGEAVIYSKGKKGEKTIPIQTEDYLDLSGEEKDQDIVPDRGLYDFMPAIRAVFYWAIPTESESSSYPTSGDGLEVISEQELKKRSKKEEFQENPFKAAFAKQKKKK